MRTLVALALTLALVPVAAADDWPQWMGPTRDNVWHETGIVETFPEGGPKRLWSVPVMGGYAGPAVVAGKVFVTDRVLGKGQKNPDNPFDTETAVTGGERVLCLDAKTGEQLWKHEYPVEYKVSFGAGPRATPAVADGKVYTLGTMGHLFCLTADAGSVVWKKDFVKDYKAKTPTWGFCGHPLVYKNLVVCLVGGPDGLVVAFDKDTGKEAWKSIPTKKPGEFGYAPPTVLKLNGADQIVMYHPNAVAGLDPATGKQLWAVKHDPGEYGMSIMAPRQSGNRVFAAGEEGGVAFEVKAGNEVAELWRVDKKTGFNPVNMTPFVEGDVIYGVDSPGLLRAVDLKTGKRLWHTFEPVIDAEQEEGFKGAGSGTAFLVKNGDRFFVFNEKGSLLIAKLSPQKPEVVSRAKLVTPTGVAWGRKVVWTHPAFAEKCVFVRTDKEIACFSLAK